MCQEAHYQKNKRRGAIGISSQYSGAETAEKAEYTHQD